MTAPARLWHAALADPVCRDCRGERITALGPCEACDMTGVDMGDRDDDGPEPLGGEYLDRLAEESRRDLKSMERK